MSTSIQLIVAGVVVLGIVVAVAVLTWHGSITGEACVAILSGILNGAMIGGAVHAGVNSGSKAAVRGSNAARGGS